MNLQSMLTEQDEAQIKERLGPIVDAWMERFTLPNRTVRDRECVYALARNCYLTGLLVDRLADEPVQAGEPIQAGDITYIRDGKMYKCPTGDTE